jgi:cytidylate kinase
MENYIIALDGVSGSGKSSTAKRVAEKLDIQYLDTGAMYRALTFLCQRIKIPFTNTTEVIRLSKTLQFDLSLGETLIVNKEDLSHQIRRPEVSAQVSDYCTIKEVREVLVRIQRQLGNSRSSIMDGRDIATVVFPEAKFKFFLWASPEVRAERRLKELKQKGISSSYEEVLLNLQERDKKDSSRKHSPLAQAEDAEFLDTSGLSFNDQVKMIVDKVTKTCTESS